MISQSFIEEVQSKTDITEIISSYIPLRKAGRNFKALCPFHGEKTPSFVVSPQKQIFHCFGCGEGGSVFQFLTLIEKINFPEAVEILAKRLGLTIPYQKDRNTKTKTVLYEAMNEAALFFHNTLKNNNDCQFIRNYLSKRGVGEKAVDKFLIGYAGGNNSLLTHMRKEGFTLEILEKASLVTSYKSGFRDLFYSRITFPIFDIRSRIVGFGGRVCKEAADSPKYINSLENILYSKRNHLFGLNFSKEDIIKENAAIVVEGYLDMITPFMSGIRNIVASLGTALTDEQIRLIKRYASCVILIYDSDKAGQMAASRSVELLLENDLKVKVVKLPAGYDPDSLIREKGKDCFSRFLNERRDFFEYKLDVSKNTYDIGSIEGKTKIARDMLVVISKLNSEIEKYEYIRKLAANLGVKEEIMIAEFQNAFSKDKSTYKGNKLAGNRELSFKDIPRLRDGFMTITEKIILKFMVTNHKAFSLIRKNLKEEHFNSYLARKTISYFFNTYSEKEKYFPSKLLGPINDKEIRGFISEILMDESIPSDKELFKESLLKLRRKGITQLKKQLKDRIREVEAKGDRQKLRELINEYNRVK